MPKKPDFAGWVTKKDILCTDGVVIKQDAFVGNSGSRVPLVWQHNYDKPGNVLGYMELENRSEGVYGYGYFNETATAEGAKELIRHGDIRAMSIGANKIRKQGRNVVHGSIYEVSLVMVGANSGATIDYTNLEHSDTEDFDNGEGIIYNGMLVHSGEEEPELEEETADEVAEELEHADGGAKVANNIIEDVEETVGDVLDTLSEKQKIAVAIAFGADDEDVPDETDEEDETVTQSEWTEGEGTLKQSVFNSHAPAEGVYIASNGNTLTHSDISSLVSQAAHDKANSLVDVLGAAGIAESDLKHGIGNLEVLFPTTQLDGGVQVVNPAAKNVDKILNAVSKSPFSRVKNIFADLTEEDARARGYITGNQKLDSISQMFFRETLPTTVYVRQMIDRDDVLDIEENGIDIVAFTKANLLNKLKESLVQAIFVGDNRPPLVNGQPNKDKINENNIRPIATDGDLFTIKKTAAKYEDFVSTLAIALVEYQGSGNATLYMNPLDATHLRLAKDANGRPIFAAYDGAVIASLAQVAASLGVEEIVETRALKPGYALCVNLQDYGLGAVKGGQITNFDFFDIDFNQYKYLAETRLSGALKVPKSAIYITIDEGKSATIPAIDFTKGADTKPTWSHGRVTTTTTTVKP